MSGHLTFGPYVLDPRVGTLLRQGLPVPLSYRGFLLLTAFLERPGEVLSKSDLLDAAWQGAAVEEANLTVQIALLRKHLGTSPGGADWIATVPRVGYRFVGAVQRQAEQARTSAAGDELLGRPSIAVLPFLNLGDDRARDYFADGITEDIITSLSRLRWLFVVARNSTHAYRGRAPDVREVARDLGVRYVLEGSVRRAGDRLRVTSHLIDATTGATVWADRYDRPAADVFAVQDEITGNVVASLEPQLYAAENERLQVRPPESLDAWGHVMRAMPQIWTWAEEDSVTALADLRRALEVEPDYARAHSLMSMTYIRGAHMGWASYADVAGPALDSARRAVERDGEDPWGHLALGFVYMLSRQARPAIGEIEEAIWLNPNFALAHVVLGCAYGYEGAGEEGLGHLATGMRLSPRDPHQSLYQSASGLCHFVAGRYQECIALNRRAVQLRPRFTSAWRSLAAAAGVTGDVATAAAALAEARRLHPDLSVDWVERFYPMVRPDHRATYIEGLRNAGLR
jgi:TolB-like protein